MRLILHIGAEKTGTTTMQEWFCFRRPLLEQYGVYYPTSLGPDSHRLLAVFAMDPAEPDEEFPRLGLHTPEDHRRYCDALRAAFAHEHAAHAHCHTWVISSEHLQSRLVLPEMIERVRAFLAPHFDDIDVVAHLRPQVDVAVSLVSTRTRGGEPFDVAWIAPPPEEERVHFEYDQLIERWESVFGAEAVIVVPYRRKPDLMHVLIDWLGLEAVRPKQKRFRRNESMDWSGIALLNTLMRHDPSSLHEVYAHDWPTYEKLSIGIDAAKRFQAAFEESNQRLIARRRELLPGDLTPDWSAYDKPSNVERLGEAEPFGAVLAYLELRMRAELLIEQCMHCLTQHDLAVVRGDASAPALVARARQLLEQVTENEATVVRIRELRERIAALAP